MNIETVFGLIVFFGALIHVVYHRCKSSECDGRNQIDY